MPKNCPPDWEWRARSLVAISKAREEKGAEAGTATPSRRLALRSVAKLAGSSPATAAPTLAKVGWDDLAARAGALAAPAKVAVLLDQVRRYTRNGEKVLVFT